MPTITGRTKLPGGTMPLLGTWHVKIRTTSGAAKDADGTIRAGEDKAVDIGDGATMVLPAGGYEFRFESSSNSSALGGKVHLGWYAFDLTSDVTWGAIMETPTEVPVTPADVTLAEQARIGAEAARDAAIAAAGGGATQAGTVSASGTTGAWSFA